MLLYLLADQPQTDVWHDPVVLTIIGSIATIFAGIIGAFVTYWVFRKQRSKKEISYQIISDAPIATINEEFKKRVAIMLDGKIVSDVRQVVLKIRSSGNAAVRRDDYDEPIRVTFKSSLILGSDILSTEPENLIKSIDKSRIVTYDPAGSFDEETEATLGKILLNPRQAITLTFLLDRAYKELDIRGRIVDGEIVRYRDKQTHTSTYVIVSMMVVVMVAIYSIGLYYFHQDTSNLYPVLFVITIITSLVLLLISRSK